MGFSRSYPPCYRQPGIRSNGDETAPFIVKVVKGSNFLCDKSRERERICHEAFQVKAMQDCHGNNDARLSNGTSLGGRKQTVSRSPKTIFKSFSSASPGFGAVLDHTRRRICSRMTSLVTEHSDWHPLHCLQPFREADAQNNSTISRTETHTHKKARTHKHTNAK